MSCAAGAYCTYRCGGRRFEYTCVTYDTSARYKRPFLVELRVINGPFEGGCRLQSGGGAWLACNTSVSHGQAPGSWHIHTAHVTWVQAAGETVRTARSARGNTGTRAGPNGETGEKCASLTSGSAHCTGKPRGSGWDSGRTKLPNPRAPPMPSDADRGGGWERVRRDRRVARGPPRPPLRASVNLYHCCRPAFDSIPRLYLRADRQEPLPMFRCPGLPGFP